jgi:hypothetical protein
VQFVRIPCDHTALPPQIRSPAVVLLQQASEHLLPVQSTVLGGTFDMNVLELMRLAQPQVRLLNVPVPLPILKYIAKRSEKSSL